MKKYLYGLRFFSCIIFLLIFLVACKESEPECVMPDTKKVLEITPLRLPKPKRNPDANFCKCCVMAAAGFISCQAVYDEKGETTGELREKAREKACKDAGYTLDTCPEEKILTLFCKGEKQAEEPFSKENPLIKP